MFTPVCIMTFLGLIGILIVASFRSFILTGS